MLSVLKRILLSKKVQMGIAGILAGVLAIWLDADYTAEILTLIGMVTTTLVGGQAAIDFKHGSPSDGTKSE